MPFVCDKDFEIKVLKLPVAGWLALVELRESLLLSSETVNVTGTTQSGNPGNFDVSAKPRPDADAPVSSGAGINNESFQTAEFNDLYELQKLKFIIRKNDVFYYFWKT